jgi:hypothetical protein
LDGAVLNRTGVLVAWSDSLHAGRETVDVDRLEAGHRAAISELTVRVVAPALRATVHNGTGVEQAGSDCAEAMR